MAITITSQPNGSTFWSSEYPLVIKATSNLATIKFIKFQIKSGGSALDIPAYYAPKINNEFVFNVADYMNSFLTVIKDEFVSFDATPTIHYYDHLLKLISLDLTEINTSNTQVATSTTNGFYVTKAKHQVYNANGTAQEYFDNRYFLSSLPYSRQDLGSFDVAFFQPRDGRQTSVILSDYSRVAFFNFALGVTGGLSAIAYIGNTSYATLTIDTTLAGGLFQQSKICAVPVNLGDLNAISIGSGESGWQLTGTSTGVSVSTIEGVYTKIGIAISNTTDSAFASMEFLNPAKLNIKCPTTFIYMNRFGIHETLTVHSKTNEAVVSSRDNTTLINTNALDAHTNDLGAYLLTGARQRAINTRSEYEFKINSTLNFTPEDTREILLDFFASPVHYVVDTDTAFGTAFDVTHPDTGYQKVRRITINDGKVDAIKNNRAQKIAFTYRYADKI